MFSIKKYKSRGFTIVELLIVIVVIGILATLVITTYNGIQQKARDTKRKTDIDAIQGQIEAYNSENGYYPTFTQMNTPSFVSNNMKGLDLGALADPQSGCDSATTGCLVTAPAAKAYAYQPTPSGCDNSTTDCTSYTLTATLEAGGTFVKTGSD